MTHRSLTVPFASGRRLLLAACAATIVLFALGSAPARAATCDTSWSSAVSGNWNDASKWSAGIPTSSTNACITVNGTYTVTLPGVSESAKALTLGGTSGVQTVAIQATDACSGAANAELTLAGGGSITTQGVIDLTHSGACGNGAPFLEVTAGQTLTNAGTIQTDLGTASGSTPDALDGNITNSGTININTGTRYDQNIANGTLDNKGTINLANAVQLTVVAGDGSTVTNDTGGSITNGTGSGDLYVDSSNTYNQGAGTTSPSSVNPTSPAVYVNSSTLNYTGAGASSVVFRGSGNLSGNLASGQNLTIQATDFCSGAVNATASIASSLTNAGEIDLNHTGSCGSAVPSLEVKTGATLTNSGTIQTDLGTASGSTPDALDGNITNSGTININTGTRYDQNIANGTLDNKGTINFANAVQLTVVAGDGSTVTNDTGGSITNGTGSGDLYVDSSNTYNQGAGTTSPSSVNPTSPAVYVNSSTLNYTGAGASSVVFRGSGNLNGNLASGQNLTIQATDFCSGAVNATASIASSLTNAGEIDLNHTGSCGSAVPFLEVKTGATLTNSGTIQTDLGTASGSTPDALDGNITNSGTININTGTRYDQNIANGTLDNKGTIKLANAVQLTVVAGNGSTVTNDTGGSITNGTGSGDLYVDSSNTYNQGAGTISPSTAAPTNPAVFVNNSTLNYTGTGKGTIAFRGAGTLTGNLGSGQNLLVEGTDFCGGAVNASLNPAHSFTNSGTITLSHVGNCGNGTDTVTIPSGDTLTNKGTISAVAGTAAAIGRTITGTVNSTGTISVAKSVKLVLNGTLTNFSSTTNTLTGGKYALTGIFQYVNSAFATSGIVNNASTITLTGTGAAFTDQNSANALRNLASNTKSLTLASKANLSTSSSLSNSGTLGIGAGSKVTVAGSYTQTAAGIWNEGIASKTSFGLLSATGTAALAGTLAISSTGSYTAGQSMTIVSAATRTGTFGSITQTSSGASGALFAVSYTSTGVVVTVQAAITLMPGSGAPGSSFTVKGSGFSPGETVTITFGATSLTPAVATGTGTISQGETVPSVAAGSYAVTATGQTSAESVTATFKVT